MARFFSMPFGLIETVIIICVVLMVAHLAGLNRQARQRVFMGLAMTGVIVLSLLVLGSFLYVSARHSEVQLAQEAAVAVAHAEQQAASRQREVELAQRDVPVGQSVSDSSDGADHHTVIEVHNGLSDDTLLPRVVLPAYGQALIAGSPWTDAVEEHQDFKADVYPSIHAAAEALGRDIGMGLNGPSDGTGQEPLPIYVWLVDDTQQPSTREGVLLVTRPVLDAVAEGIREKLIQPARVSVERPTTDHAVIVRIDTADVRFDSHNKWRQQAESGTGKLVADVRGPVSSTRFSVPFVQAPWVDDPAGFARNYQGGHWLVAYSPGVYPSQAEARREALKSAATSLLHQAEALISGMSVEHQHRYERKRASDPDWLLNRVTDELVSRNHATDFFSQRFDRPYGPVWREAVLIDAEPGMVESIARALVGSLRAQSTAQTTTLLSMVVLSVLIVGLYLFLNLATKGYYTWMLRLAAVIGVAALVLFMRMV